MVSSIDLAAAYAESGVAEVLEQLDQELIGLTPVKTRIREIAALLVDQARRSWSCPARHRACTCPSPDALALQDHWRSGCRRSSTARLSAKRSCGHRYPR